MQLLRVFVLSISALGVAICAHADPIRIAVDTSPLSGIHTVALALTNADGSANTVSLSSFDFGGGSGVDGSADCTLGGTLSGLGCSGDVVTGVTLQDVDFTALFTQQFEAGSTLSFRLTATNDFSGPFPDQFALYICDATIISCYSDDASGAMLLLNLAGGTISPSNFELFGAAAQDLDAPTVAPVPDRPETLVLALVAALPLFALARHRKLNT